MRKGLYFLLDKIELNLEGPLSLQKERLENCVNMLVPAEVAVKR